MILALDAVIPGATREWTYTFAEPRGVVFACISPRSGALRVEVSFNGELVEVLTTSVPHSWWKWAGNPIFPGGQAVAGDELIIRLVSGQGDLRIDFE